MAKFKQVPQSFLFEKLVRFWGNMVKKNGIYNYPVRDGDEFTPDFGGYSVKVKKAIEQFKRDGEFAPLAAYLPKELGKVPRQQLRVCGAAVQLEFFSIMCLGDSSQPTSNRRCQPSKRSKVN